SLGIEDATRPDHGDFGRRRGRSLTPSRRCSCAHEEHGGDPLHRVPPQKTLMHSHSPPVFFQARSLSRIMIQHQGGCIWHRVCADYLSRVLDLFSMLRIILILLFLLISAAQAWPQNPSPGDWPSYARDYGSTGYSPLVEIQRENVSKLHQICAYSLPEQTTF